VAGLSERVTRVLLGLVVLISAAVAMAWVFYVPILEAPDETVHFEYSTALYLGGGLVAPRDVAHMTIPAGRAIPDPVYLENQSAVAVLAEKPDMKAPAGYGTAAYFGSVDQGVRTNEPTPKLLDPPLLRYYPFGYYLLDAAFMGVTSLFTNSPVALFFAARSLSAALLIPSLLFTYLLFLRLRCSRALALTLTAVAGLFPMTSMMASSVQSDNLSFTLVTLSLLAAMEVRAKPDRGAWVAVLGGALGALLVTKVHLFSIVTFAVLAMLLSQRIDKRSWPRWRRDVALLVGPAVLLEAVQVWTQWGAPPLISPGQLGNVQDFRSALAGGPVTLATYGLHLLSFSFLDHSFGREFGSFWGVFGWVDTPLILGSADLTHVIWLLIAGVSIVLLFCALARFGSLAWRLLRVARRGRPRRALSIAFSNPVAISYFVLALFLFTVEGYPGIQGRYYFPVLPAVFWVGLKYAPRALPGKFGPALFRMQVVGLVAYTVAGAVFAFPTLTDRYYGHGRDLVAVSRTALVEDAIPGRYEITHVRLPEATLGVGALPTGRVGVVGWAVDQVAGAPARTVFIDIDGRPFQQAVYGDDSAAAVTALGSDRYARCGFDAILDTTGLTPGVHALTVRVVSADGTRLYGPGPPVQFESGVSIQPGQT
jgi:hypothetical protein